jgi:uncharacterized protein (TIGR02246 family)
MGVLEEKDAIREVLFRFCAYLDAKQTDRIAQLFTPDCRWDGGPLGVTEGRDQLTARMEQIAAKAPPILHCVTNEVIRIHSGEARAYSYVSVLGNKQEPAMVLFAGAYLDVLMKREGRWEIRDRRIARELPDIDAFIEAR